MRARMLLLLVLAVGTGLGTVLLARQWMAAQRPAAAQVQPAPEPPRVTRVLVAAADLSAGRFLVAEDLRWQVWPDVALAPNSIVEGAQSAEDVVGAVVRSRIAAGELITEGRLVRPGDRGFLAAVLAPGMRAVAVPITETTGIAGLVFPGDRVDVILSHGIHPDDPASSTLRRAGETVLTDIRVLAIDQSLDDQGGEPLVGQTATLEVTPRQAEKIAVMLQLGSIGLSLRSLAQSGPEADPQSGPEADPQSGPEADPQSGPEADPQSGSPSDPKVDTAERPAAAAAAGPAGAVSSGIEPHQTYALDTDVSLVLRRPPAASVQPQITVVRGSSSRHAGSSAARSGGGPSEGLATDPANGAASRVAGIGTGGH